MSLDNLTIPMWCEHWARWSVMHVQLVKGFPSVSMIADKWSFQGASEDNGAAHQTPLGERVFTARGKETRSLKLPEIPDDAYAEVLDMGISQMGVYRPDLQIVVGGEYLGGFPELFVENWKPGDEQLKKFTRLQAAWSHGHGYRMNFMHRRAQETANMWRSRLAQKLGISRAQFYNLLSEAHVYLLCWRDTELKRLIESETNAAA